MWVPISVCLQYWRQMQSPSDSALWNSKQSNFNILNSFHSMYLGLELRNSTEKPQIVLDFVLNFVLLLVKGCSWLVTTVTHRKWSPTVTCCDLWHPQDRAQPISLSSSACIWKCMCVYATAVCSCACCLNFSTDSPSPGLLLMTADLGWTSHSSDTEVNGKCCLSTVRCGAVCTLCVH